MGSRFKILHFTPIKIYDVCLAQYLRQFNCVLWCCCSGLE